MKIIDPDIWNKNVPEMYFYLSQKLMLARTGLMPLVVFVICKAQPDSLWFSTAELVFGYSACGLLEVLKGQFMSTLH